LESRKKERGFEKNRNISQCEAGYIKALTVKFNQEERARDAMLANTQVKTF